MTKEARLMAFIEGYQALVQQYGVQWTASNNFRQLGEVLQIDVPTIGPAFVEGWQPPVENPEPPKENEPLPAPPLEQPPQTMLMGAETSNGKL